MKIIIIDNQNNKLASSLIEVSTNVVWKKMKKKKWKEKQED